jgi:hypothetical protein
VLVDIVDVNSPLRRLVVGGLLSIAVSPLHKPLQGKQSLSVVFKSVGIV